MHVSRKEFDRMVEEAIDALPAEYARWVEEVPVIVEDRPSQADLQGMEDGDDEGDPLGLYVGSSLEEGDVSGVGGGLPARVMLYRVPLMEACETREELAEEIRKTLLHELGHHAGLDEEDLEERGFGPMEDDDDDVEWDVD